MNLNEGVPPVPRPVSIDRALGAVVASAAGDALGAPFEFGPPLGADVIVAMDGGGGFGWDPGEWTDDTQMALAILTPLATGAAQLTDIEAGFCAWFASGPTDVGIQTTAILSSTEPLAEAAAAFTAARPSNAAGNGSLMRTGPIALSHPGDPDAIAALARAVSELTHPDTDCVDACVIWSVAIDDAIHRAPASDELWDWVDSLREATTQIPVERRARWLALIDEASVSVPTDFPKNGWVIHAFQAALAAILSTPVPDGPAAGTHLRLALEAAVRGGGDTDTVAAIAGSLLGARWGATAVPFAWRRVVHGHRIYGEAPLAMSDLERLARLAYQGGKTDGTGWPTVASMADYYAREWKGPVRREALEGVEFGNVAALPDAIADGVDVVVSLCRMGTNDVPDGVEHHVLGLLDTTVEENPNAVLLVADLTDGLAALVDDGRRVYVHCVQAENRTPTVAAAWLHRHRGFETDEAVARAADSLNRPKKFLIETVEATDRIPPW